MQGTAIWKPRNGGKKKMNRIKIYVVFITIYFSLEVNYYFPGLIRSYYQTYMFFIWMKFVIRNIWTKVFNVSYILLCI